MTFCGNQHYTKCCWLSLACTKLWILMRNINFLAQWFFIWRPQLKSGLKKFPAGNYDIMVPFTCTHFVNMIIPSWLEGSLTTCKTTKSCDFRLIYLSMSVSIHLYGSYSPGSMKTGCYFLWHSLRNNLLPHSSLFSAQKFMSDMTLTEKSTL